MRRPAVWFALNARLAKLSPYSIALGLSQAQKKITETSASEVQRKLVEGARLCASDASGSRPSVSNNSARCALACLRASYASNVNGNC